MQKETQTIIYDPRDLIDLHIKKNGLKQSWVADQLEISHSHFSLVLSKERDLAEKHRTKLNELWGTEY